MKKNILLLSILFLPFVLFSQNKTIEIYWGVTEKSMQGASSTENKASKSNSKSATQLLDLLIDQEMLFSCCQSHAGPQSENPKQRPPSPLESISGLCPNSFRMP